MDGVLQLDDVEEHLVHENFTVDTRDHEDHTFCGVMFDAVCDTDLPAEYIEVQSISVRGDLGPMTVWSTPDTFQGKTECEEMWEKQYSATHERSRRDYTELVLPNPIRLQPGERVGIYVHSGLPGDEGLVYDNQRHAVTYQDRVLKIYPGVAHLSNRPFGKRGFWGRPWRTGREFVGRMNYGVRWKMWQPNEIHRTFPVGFQKAVMTMIMASRREESLMYLLQDEIVFFIMNKCSWDWFGTEMPGDNASGGVTLYSEGGGSSSNHQAGGSSSGGGGGGGSHYYYGRGNGGGHAFDGASLFESLLGTGGASGYFSRYGPSFNGQQYAAYDSDEDDDEDYDFEEQDDSEEEEEDEEGEEEDDEEESGETTVQERHDASASASSSSGSAPATEEAPAAVDVD